MTLCVPLKFYFKKHQDQNWPEVSNLIIPTREEKTKNNNNKIYTAEQKLMSPQINIMLKKSSQT